MTFTTTGRLTDCLLLAYRTPAAAVQHLVPRGLALVTHGPWAFWNVVACRVERMRPAGLPAWCGVSYHHVAYRLYARARLADGKTIDGLYFVRSDADRRLVALPGNLAPDFRFHTADVRLERGPGSLTYTVTGGPGGDADALLVAKDAAESEPAAGSPFTSAADARAFLKYHPLAISPDPFGRTLTLAEVERDETRWRETPVRVTRGFFNLFGTLDLPDPTLELATRVAPLDYRWRLGRREQLWDGRRRPARDARAAQGST